MISHRLLVSLIAALVCCGITETVAACSVVYRSGKPVVNADQTVLILWDAATKTQHFIRQASFRSDAGDFGFLVPTPSVPELEESGDPAFDYLRRLTEPEIEQVRQPLISFGCSGAPHAGIATKSVRVLAEKLVAGLNAVVLEADSADALLAWLKDHGYEFSPAVQAWAEPYISQGWKITALKVAGDQQQRQAQKVAATSLRISFQTDQPLFPYRESDPKHDAALLHADPRLLRIYFISDGRYEGKLTSKTPWTSRVAWSGRLPDDGHAELLELLKLPASTFPAGSWLTEFEHDWPYQPAPADVYFFLDPDQSEIRRPPIYQVLAPWPEISTYILFILVSWFAVRRLFCRRASKTAS